MSIPKTFEKREVDQLLRATAAAKAGEMYHYIIHLAVKTGLREHELLALNVGDVLAADGRVKFWVQLHVYKRSNPDPAAQQVRLNTDARNKILRLAKFKRDLGQDLSPEAPLFVSRQGNRLSTRQLRTAFARWQRRAGLDRVLTFHALRHTAITNVYNVSHNIKSAQRFARHASVTSTDIYTHASDADVASDVERI